jgi:hypothetical protein
VSDSAERDARRQLEAALDAAGWNLRGVIPASRYDARVAAPWRSAALLPEARRALVLGSGGRALFSAYRRSPEFGVGPDPLDAFCERVAAEAAARLSGCCVLAHQQREGVFADLVALGVEAGLGVASRLSLLVHPVYGPWLSIRAAVLTPHRLELTTPLEGFDPCTGCPAPCADACHGGAVPPTGFRVDRCGETRAREPACDLRCDARRACVVGPEHAYEAGAEAHHMRLSGTLPGS